MRRKKPLADMLKQLLACMLSMMIIIPFLMILLNSFKTQGEAALMNLTLPAVIQWENYIIAIERGRLVQSFFNSALYAIGGTFLTITVTSMAAFVLARRRTKFNQWLYLFMVMGIMLPVNFVALMRVMQMLRLINSQYGIIMLYTATGISFGVFIIYGFVGTIPRELDEAAIIDGAGAFGLFFRVIFPLLKPVLITVMVLNFMGIWNDFIIPLYLLNRSRYWPMTLAIYSFFGRYEQEWNLVFANIVMTCLPVFIIYLLAQKQIVSGMLSGAVKG